MSEKITLSVIKADVGGWPGHSDTHPELKKTAKKFLDKHGKELVDYHVTSVGDDVQLIMTHRLGEDSGKIHELAWDAFQETTDKAKDLGLYGAGQDLLSDAFSGNIRGLGPGIAEMEFEEREAEPVAVFMMDKTEPGAFNFPMYKAFADPFNTAGLVIDPNVTLGFNFEVWDIKKERKVTLKAPEEMYELLSLIGTRSRYVIKKIYPAKGNKNPSDQPVASVSTEKLYEIAGEYVGKDDPVAVVRAQSGFPALGEIIEPYSFPYAVAGWMRGSHNGPIMPVSLNDAQCTRFDGPPRVASLGFQLSDGKLGKPSDLFDDPAFDQARKKAQKESDYFRRHGPFEPHRLPEKEMEYTTLPENLELLEDRFEPVED